MRKCIGLAALTASALLSAGWLTGCGGSPPKPVSLVRTYSLVDSEGRTSGTVVLNPVGGGELRDVDGTVIGIISASGGGAAPAATPAPQKKG